MAETRIIQGVPVLIRATDIRRTGRLSGRPRKREEVRKKAAIMKLTPKEMELLTKRQRDALRNYVETGLDPAKKREAAETAGYSPGTNAVNMLNRVLDKPFVRERLVKALEDAGVTRDKIAQVIAAGLEAKHPFKPEQKDWHAIAKFVAEANRLHDHYPATKIEQTVNKREIRLIMTSRDAEAFAKFKRLRESHGTEGSGSAA